MYTRISWVKWWLLGIVTFGIYNLIMWHKMTKNLNQMSEAVGEKKIMGFIPQLLLGFVTCGIVSIIWIIKFFAKLSKLNAAKNAGLAPANGFVMFLISLVPIYSFVWLAGANNKLADVYEN